MTARYVLAIDQGTSSSRCMVFDATGGVVAAERAEHRQIRPRPGWVEHDPDEIWQQVRGVTGRALDHAGLSHTDIAAIGITNQRETIVVWDASTGEPIGNAVVWQDTRTDQLIRSLAAEHDDQWWRARCGLPLSTYFSGPKLRWLLDRDPGLRRRAEAGEVRFGTIDSWLVERLTGAHVTDVTNASRTMLMNLSTLDWDGELLDAMGVPRAMLPRIVASSQVYGLAGGRLAGVPVSGALGDQQAALVGQACFEPGEAKCTYGTGAFVLVNTGSTPVPGDPGLLTTVGYRFGQAPAVYALEGAIAVTGALIGWLRDNLGVISSVEELNRLAASVPDTGGCCVVPAFSGLYAPHWRPDARGVITGLTSYVTRAHLARAALEAAAWQVVDVVETMNARAGAPLTLLKVDGGMTASDLLLQIQADLLGVPVVRPTVTETTCLGAAYAAGLAVGFWPDPAGLREHWRIDRRWEPSLAADEVSEARTRWRKAVARSLDWV